MSARLTTDTPKIKRAIARANLVVRNEFEIRRAQTLTSGGWAAFLLRKPTRMDPRLRISNFDPHKKHYPRYLEDLDVIPGRS